MSTPEAEATGEVVRVEPGPVEPAVVVRDLEVEPEDVETVTGEVLDPVGVEVSAFRKSVHPKLRVRVVLIHLSRVPLYWVRVLARSPHGVARVLRSLARWSRDERGAAMVATVLGDKSQHKALLRHEARVARRRRVVVVLVGETGLGGAFVTVWFWPVLSSGGVVPAVAGVLTLVGLVGRDRLVPIVGRVVTSDSSEPPSMDLIIVALGSLGIPELSRAITRAARSHDPYGGLGWPAPIREEGAGWRSDIDLPPGVTAAQIVERRPRLASGLRRQVSAVWPAAEPEVHAGRLVLYVAHKPMSQTKLGAWPLLPRGSVSLFEPFLVGVDPRGRGRTVTLIFASMLVGAIPRQGKSFAARLIVLAAALDPRAELHIYDLKAGADWLPLEPVSHRFLSGQAPEHIERLVADLDEMVADMGRRYDVLRGLSRDECPEGKVTPELSERKELGLHPVVLMVDEVQFGVEDETFGQAIERRLADLVKRGPAAGFVVILATQRPDAKSLPKSISDNAVLRLCLKVLSATANNMVLGNGSYEAGVNATLFNRSERGVGWLVGEEDEPSIVRFYKVTRAEADAVVKRARAARVALGTLTGHAAGQDAEEVVRDRTTMLDHLAEVWPMADGERVQRVWWTELAEALAERYPRYAGVTAKAVSAGSGLPGVQVKRTVIDGDNKSQVVNKRGAAYEDLLVALAARNGDDEKEAQ